MKRFRLRRVSLGGAMALIAVITLAMALIQREIRHKAEVARLRKLVNPNFLEALDKNPEIFDMNP
jgi:hypothetical protein